MSQVVTFESFQPSDRFDNVPWSAAEVYEGATVTGPWVLIDTIALNPVDVDPAHPAFRNLTTSAASETDGLWYQLVFIDGSGNIGQPTTPIQNLASAATPYATVEELARILKIRAPSDAQTAAMRRVLAAAASEIDDELGLTTPHTAPTALVVQVNLDRAADLWRHTESIPGITGLLGDDGTVPVPGRYSWERYAQRLANQKATWGLA